MEKYLRTRESRLIPSSRYTKSNMLPRIGITMGDAAGIGPEIIVKALSYQNIYQMCQPIVIGSPAIIQDALRFNISNDFLPKVSRILSPKHATATYGTIDVLDVSTLKPEDISLGTIDSRCGTAAVQAIEAAVKLTLDGMLDAITTAPICKASIQRAGSPFPGHTEMLASLTHSKTSVMMLKTWDTTSQFESGYSIDLEKVKKNSYSTTNPIEDLTVSFVTNHIPIAEVSQQLSMERISDVIRITHDALVRFGVEKPRLVVAGLNPHAGEEGMFGNEEQTDIMPAVRQANAAGLHVDGPLPADTLFRKTIQGKWDAVIVMYHDQGNIPIKLIGFGQVVNITLGLPIVRTSVDHGTAFDIAGQGIANETSLIAALAAATQLASSQV